MAYFRELPNLQYISVFKDRNYNDEYTETKNIFKRPKIRTDIAEAITAFEYYQIIGDERPDQIAEKYYSNSELDWIILITNNITNVNEGWPLNNTSLYKYMLDKYGSEEELFKVHHYETVEYKDEFGRVLIEGGLQVDSSVSEVIQTNPETTEYELKSFPTSNLNQFISVNLNQQVEIKTKDSDTPITIDITNINVNTSFATYVQRDINELGTINIVNSLANWPNGWGGILKVQTRDNSEVDVVIKDVILDNKVRIPERLYEITGVVVDGLLRPIFKFTNEIV
jgi:hypothetical protein